VHQDLTLAEAARVSGARLEGDPGRVFGSTAPLERALPGDLTLYDGRQESALVASTQASAVVVPESFDDGCSTSLLRSDAPQRAFLTLARELWSRRSWPGPGVAPSASVHPEARLADGVHVGEHAVVGEGAELRAGAAVHAGAVIGAAAVVGARSVVHAAAVVGPGARIGADCTIHAGAVIGFAYRPSAPDEPLSQAVSCAAVVIEDGVQIGPNAVVEDGESEPTTVCRGAKVGAQVCIGHDCVVGPGANLVAMVGLASGVRIGAEATLFGQVGVGGDLTIGERAIVYAKSGVACDIPPDGRYFGLPARPRGEATELLAAVERARDLELRVERLEAAARPR
jgi:UDP-3-O-[3-hydroxymyristoyl] glucosamine N-acyltransferase